MRKLGAVLVVVVVSVLVVAATSVAAQPQARTFVAVLNAEEEVPACGPATEAARGVAVFHVRDGTTGEVDYQVIANNLPGTPIAAHIHVAPVGMAGPIVEPLPLSAGAENGVIGRGTFTNPVLVSAIRATPGGYYVNVHTGTCPSGVIRGQLDDHGPLNN